MIRISMLTISSVLVLMILIFVGCATNFEKSSKTFNAMGYEHHKKGQYDKAIVEYNRALELNPQNVEAYVNRGNAYEAMGAHEDAITDYNRAIEINPNYGGAYMNKGVVYARMGQYDQAISDISRGIDIDPKNGEMYFNRANVFFYKHEYDKVWDDVNKAQELGWQVHPGFLQDLRNASGKKYIKIKVDDQVQYGGKWKFNVAPGDVLEVIREKTCLDGKGECWEVRNIKTGETGFVPAERMKSWHYVYFQEKKETDPIALFKQGRAFGTKDQHDQAIVYCNKAIEINPKFAEAYNTRGIAYKNKGQYDRAISDYNKALEINPKSAEPYNNRGNAYAKGKGQYDKAISDYNEAIEINPRYADAYYNRGLAYAKGKDQYDKAISDYNEAIEINPKHARAYNNRGIAYKQKGRDDKAISDYNKAIEIDPKLAIAYNNRGFVYLVKSGNKKKACSDWKRACELGSCKYYESAKRKGDCK